MLQIGVEASRWEAIYADLALEATHPGRLYKAILAGG